MLCANATEERAHAQAHLQAGDTVSPPRATARPLRRLADGDILFQKGDTRSALYRVESGALCHYIVYDDGRHEVIEFAFPGDIVGLGHLESHVSTAQAVVATEVSQLPAADLDHEIAINSQLGLRLAMAADREFDALRARAMAVRTRSPRHKLAALLAALSHINGAEGRDPALIGDDLTPAAVANQLDLEIGEVALALADLRRLGLVAPFGKGLKLEDIAAIERIADAA